MSKSAALELRFSECWTPEMEMRLRLKMAELGQDLMELPQKLRFLLFRKSKN